MLSRISAPHFQLSPDDPARGLPGPMLQPVCSFALVLRTAMIRKRMVSDTNAAARQRCWKDKPSENSGWRELRRTRTQISRMVMAAHIALINTARLNEMTELPARRISL